MQTKTLFIIVAAIAVSIGLVMAYDSFQPEDYGPLEQNPNYASENSIKNEEASKDLTQGQEVEEPAMPSAKGDVAGAIQSLLLDASVDQSDFASEEADADLIGDDATAIGDFGQSYNENEL